MHTSFFFSIISAAINLLRNFPIYICLLLPLCVLSSCTFYFYFILFFLLLLFRFVCWFRFRLELTYCRAWFPLCLATFNELIWKVIKMKWTFYLFPALGEYKIFEFIVVIWALSTWGFNYANERTFGFFKCAFVRVFFVGFHFLCLCWNWINTITEWITCIGL